MEHCSSSLKIAHQFDKVTVPMLGAILGADASELVLFLPGVDADSALLNQPLDKKVPQSHVFYSRAGGPVPGDV